MRKPKYLSPTSATLWLRDRDEWFIKYCSDMKPPSIPQTQPMAAGSATDAFIKAYLHENLFGKTDGRFELSNIFEQQVDSHNRDWAWPVGEGIFEQYKASGALADLMAELRNAAAEPRFEFRVEGNIFIDGVEVPLAGYPDLFFITSEGYHVMYDFKVNGYCSKRAISPKPGYIICRDGWNHDEMPHSRNHKQMHKDAQPIKISGIMVNVAKPLEDSNTDWARQLSTYSWLEGEAVGSGFIAGIEQFCGMGDNIHVRIASHRAKVSKEFQEETAKLYKKIWESVTSGLFFIDQMDEDSCIIHQQELNARFGSADNPDDVLFSSIVRENRPY